MKKVLAFLLVGVMSIGLLAGCGSKRDDGGKQANVSQTSAEQEAEPKADEDQPFIGISVPKAVTGWTAAATYYAEAYCKANNLNYKLVQAESTNDQANQIDELISQKPDVIVLLPINDELATAAQTIKDAGITLVNYDRTLGSVEPDYYLAGDNPGCGEKGADWMVEQLGTDFTVVVCSITSWGNIAEERKVGFEERLKEIAPDAKIIGEYASESASQEDGLKLMADVLQSNPEVDGIFLVDDEQACGAVQAIQEAERTDIKALYAAGGGSANYLNRIKDSSYPIATASYYPSMITDAIAIAVDVSTGAASHDAKTIEEAVVINADNLDAWKESVGYDPKSPY